MRNDTTISVWDPAVRIGHGLLIVGFATAYLTEGKPAWLHEWSGYGLGAVVALRIVWGFVGPRHARFGEFLVTPMAGLRYLRDLVMFRAPRHLGHSPAGGLMVLALLASLSATTITGVTYLGMSRNRGPLAPWLGAEAAAQIAALPPGAAETREARRRLPGRWLKEIHEIAANATLALVLLHVGGVVLASIVHRENLPRAMITGRKKASPTGSGDDR